MNVQRPGRAGAARREAASGRRSIGCATALAVGLAIQAIPCPAGSFRLPVDLPWATGRLEGLVEREGGLALAPGRPRGVFVSPVCRASARFDRAVVFWNASTQAATVEILARLHRDGRALGGWVKICTWSRESRGARDAGAGEIVLDQDTLRIAEGADGIELEARLSGAGCRLTRLGATVYRADHAPGPGSKPVSRVRLERAIRHRSQTREDPSIASRICGPTSLAMALEHFGVVLPTAEVARLARDPGAPIEYGNWAYLAATAGELGLVAEVVSLDSLDEVRAGLADGWLHILSLAYPAGQLRRAPVAATDGHLVLVRGHDARGDLLAADPAGSDARRGKVRYDRGELARAWHNGIAIRVTRPGRDGRPPSVRSVAPAASPPR